MGITPDGRVWVNQQIYALSGKQFAALLVAFYRFLRSAVFDLPEDGFVFVKYAKKVGFVFFEFGRVYINF